MVERCCRTLSLLLIGLGALQPLSLRAEEDIFELQLEQLEQVIVLARKRAEDIQEVPLSISAFTSKDLLQMGVSDLVDLAPFVANFEIDTPNNLRNSAIAIRGIGSSGTNPGIEPSVGVFVDGVYLPSSAQALGELSDVATVEILRGPQGTLYGRNTPVGALNITTRRPDREFATLLRIGAGDYDLYTASGYVGGSVSDTSAARLAFWARDRDGYERNRLNGHRVDDNRDYGARLRWAVDPSDTVAIDAIVFAQHIQRTCCVAEQRDVHGPFGIASPGFLDAQIALGYPFINFNDHDHKVDADDEGDDTTDFWGASLQAEWDLEGGATLTSITSYQDWRNEVVISATALPQPVFISDQRQDNTVWSEELRIASAPQTMEYLAGLYLYRQDTSYNQGNVIGAGANRVFPPGVCGGVAPCVLVPGDSGGTDFDQKTSSIAAFGSATWNLTGLWDSTAGLRLSYDEKSAYIDQFNSPTASDAYNFAQPAAFIGHEQRDESNVTWSLSSRYQFTPSAMGFVTIATGYKSGGYNARRQPVGAAYEFDPEKSITYETGLKSTWLDQHLLINATLFHTKLDDFQEAALDPLTGAGFIVTNAGERRVRGVEIDSTVLPFRHLEIIGSVGYMDAEYSSYENGQCPLDRVPNGALPGTCDFSGDTPPKSPEWKWHLGAQWTQAAGQFEFTARTDYAWTDRQDMSPSLDEGTRVRSYGLLNARVGVGTSDGEWHVAAYVKNATDETYYLESATQPLNGLVSGGGESGAGGYVGWYGPPRTWGIELSWQPSAGGRSKGPE